MALFHFPFLSPLPQKDPVMLGILAGVLHHFLMQTPGQASLFATFYAFAIANVVFTIFVLTNSLTAQLSDASLIKQLAIFNAFEQCTALLLKIVYNVYFRHRGIPGRFWWTASDWTYWRTYWLNEKPHERLAQLHREQGDVVRIQPNHICFRSLQAVEDIHGNHTKATKGDNYRLIITQPGMPASIASETDTTQHAFLRRVMNPAFSSSSLKSLEETINGYLGLFIRGIQDRAEKNNGIVEMNEWFHNLTFDITGSLTLGVDFGGLKTGSHHFFVMAIHKGFTLMSFFLPIPWLMPLLRILPLPKVVKESRMKTVQFSRNAVESCLARESSTEAKTILGSLRRARDPETGANLTLNDLIVNSNTFLVAGADTVAVTMTFTLYYILANERVYDRLCKEVRSRFSTVEEITGQTTSTIQYLDAVIYESLRMRPATAGNLVRVTPPEGMHIAGHFIQGNTMVSLPTWAMLHDERYFSNPESFIPERWIDTEKGMETCVKEAWIPFLIGKRNCIGKPLALMELRLVCCRLIWQFDMSLREKDQDVPAFHFTSISAGPLEIRVKPVRSK